jgi:hypothetical protein
MHHHRTHVLVEISRFDELLTPANAKAELAATAAP